MIRDWAPHSEVKISIVGDYLPAFARATGSAAQRVYIDAFAGGGEKVLRTTGEQFPSSVEIALGVKPAFTHVALFEANHQRVVDLEKRAALFAGDVAIYEGDCNEHMASALRSLPVEAPTFALVDPDGLDVAWTTIARLADHKREYAEREVKAKVEMWILFPSQAILRLLGKDADNAHSKGFVEQVTRLYGASGPWESVWKAHRNEKLSSADARRAYVYLYMDRIKGLGYEYVLARPMFMSKGELYAMIFATDHLAGKTIMKWSQEKPRPVKRANTLFDMPEAAQLYAAPYDGWRDDIGIKLAPWAEFNGGG